MFMDVIDRLIHKIDPPSCVIACLKTQSKVIRQLNNLRIYQTDHFDLIISGFRDDNNSKMIQTKQEVLHVIFRRGRKAIILNCSNISFYIYPDHYNVCNAFFRDAFTI